MTLKKPRKTGQRRSAHGYMDRAALDRIRCSTPGCNCDSSEIFLHGACPHGDSGLQIGYRQSTHTLMIGCKECRSIMWEMLLDPAGQHHHEPHAWGWTDWEPLTEGYEMTWISPKCHPAELEASYRKDSGEVFAHCKVCGAFARRFQVAGATGATAQ